MVVSRSAAASASPAGESARGAEEVPLCDRAYPPSRDRLETMAQRVLTVDKAQRMAEFFSILSDPNRLRLLSLLAEEELCVCDLAAALEMSESAVSHQLRTLRAARLVRYDKRGRRAFYRLDDHHVLDLYRSVAHHLDEACG